MIVTSEKCAYSVLSQLLEWYDLNLPEYLTRNNCAECTQTESYSKSCHITLQTLIEEFESVGRKCRR